MIEAVDGLTRHVDDQASNAMTPCVYALRYSKPVNSVFILTQITKLRQELDAMLTRVEGEIEQITKLVSSLPGSSRVIKFEVFQQSERWVLKKRN
jgi:uncharacterized protein YqgV (UPF0045/DUF77 family)